MRYALVIDTCGGLGYVALYDVDAPVVALSERVLPARGTQEALLPSMQAVLVEAGRTLENVAAITVVSGPGSFTGVRIGLATAKGLCEALGLPLVTLSRLAVVATAAGLESATEQSVWACLDAGRGDVYAGSMKHGQPGTAWEKMLPAPDAEREAAAAGAHIAVYEESLLARFPKAHPVSAEAFQRAARLLATRVVQAGQWADVALCDADYLRIPDAELALRASRQ